MLALATRKPNSGSVLLWDGYAELHYLTMSRILCGGAPPSEAEVAASILREREVKRVPKQSEQSINIATREVTAVIEHRNG